MIGHRGSAAELRFGHQQIADHPRELLPSLVVPFLPEQVDVKAQVGLRVLRVHAREAPEVPLYPGAEVVHERHRLEVRRVADVGLVGLVHEAVLPDQHAVRPLTVVHQRRPLGHMSPIAFLFLAAKEACDLVGSERHRRTAKDVPTGRIERVSEIQLSQASRQPLAPTATAPAGP